MIEPAQAKPLTRFSALNFSGRTFGVGARDRDRGAQARQKAARQHHQRFVRVHVRADAIAILRRAWDSGRASGCGRAAGRTRSDRRAIRRSRRRTRRRASSACRPSRPRTPCCSRSRPRGRRTGRWSGRGSLRRVPARLVPRGRRARSDRAASRSAPESASPGRRGARRRLPPCTVPNSSMSGGTSTCSVSMSMPRRTQRTTSSSRCGPSGPITQYW